MTVNPDDYSRPKRDRFAAFASLRNRNFRLYAIGSLIATTALQMRQLAQNYLVYQLTDEATAIGYVSLALGVAVLFCSLAGGVAADRLPKRNLLIAGRLSIGCFALFIGVMVTTGHIAVWHIVVTSLAVGIVAGFTMPAQQSYVPDLVGDRNLMNALALSSGIMNVTRIGGPALAGVLIAAFGVGPVFYINFFGYGIFAVILLFIPIMGKAVASAQTTTSPMKDAVGGFRYLRGDRTLLSLLIAGLLPVILAMPYVNFLPVFQEEVFQVGEAELGLMMAMVGGGAVFGALLVASLTDYKYKGRVLIISGLGFGAALAFFGLVAGPDTFVLSLVILVFTGAFGTAFMALNQAMMLTITPPEMRGRVAGLFMMTFGLQPLGAMPIGVLIDAASAPPVIASFGAATFVFFILVTIFMPRIRNL
jgi:MFS family permease